MGRSLWPCVSGWLAVMTLMGWLFASCDNEETGVPASLPDGKYPLSMTAEINQLQTRAGGKDAWAGSEEIEVLLDGMLSPKRYVMNVSSDTAKPWVQAGKSFAIILSSVRLAGVVRPVGSVSFGTQNTMPTTFLPSTGSGFGSAMTGVLPSA